MTVERNVNTPAIATDLDACGTIGAALGDALAAVVADAITEVVRSALDPLACEP